MMYTDEQLRRVVKDVVEEVNRQRISDERRREASDRALRSIEHRGLAVRKEMVLDAKKNCPHYKNAWFRGHVEIRWYDTTCKKSPTRGHCSYIWRNECPYGVFEANPGMAALTAEHERVWYGEEAER